MTGPGDPLLAGLCASVWRTVCWHLDGVAIGGSVEALEGHGAFAALREASAPLEVDDLASRLGARPGLLHVALRLLADQGFVSRESGEEPGRVRVRLTPTGLDWQRTLETYRGAAARTESARALLLSFTPDAPAPMDQVVDGLAGEPGGDLLGPGDLIERRVRAHRDGPLVAAAVTGLGRCGALARLAEAGARGCPDEELPGPGHAVAAALAVLAAQGWLKRVAGRTTLTFEGRVVSEVAPQYWYAASYLPTLGRAGRRIFAAQRARESGEDDVDEGIDGVDDHEGVERHVDRALDIAFSGVVFRRACLEPLLSAVLPLFEREPLESQPAAIVDTGSGDGTLLVELYRAIRERTVRGRHLDAAPLPMVGVEFNEVARRQTERRLRAEGVPGWSVRGDIADPDAIAATLREHGLDPCEVLHVSKSVIHNRRFTPPGVDDGLPPFGDPDGIFVDANGDRIDARRLELDLAQTFRRFRPWMARHGMVVVEAHAVPPDAIAAAIGRAPLTLVDACHAFSGQFLVEARVFRAAARAAGLASAFSLDLDTAAVGRPLLTIDHFRPA
ncbi:MAG: AprA-related methyltransferase [Thermoanaerobaculia bacterium]